MMILTWLLIGLVIYYLFVNKDGGELGLPNKKSPEEVLRERFANGEIDAETFKNMKEVLSDRR